MQTNKLMCEVWIIVGRGNSVMDFQIVFREGKLGNKPLRT